MRILMTMLILMIMFESTGDVDDDDDVVDY